MGKMWRLTSFYVLSVNLWCFSSGPSVSAQKIFFYNLSKNLCELRGISSNVPYEEMTSVNIWFLPTRSWRISTLEHLKCSRLKSLPGGPLGSETGNLPISFLFINNSPILTLPFFFYPSSSWLRYHLVYSIHSVLFLWFLCFNKLYSNYKNMI